MRSRFINAVTLLTHIPALPPVAGDIPLLVLVPGVGLDVPVVLLGLRELGVKMRASVPLTAERLQQFGDDVALL